MFSLGDSKSSTFHDFKPSTFSITTKCELITYECIHNSTYPKFNSTLAVHSGIDMFTFTSSIGIKVFTNSSLLEVVNYTYQNPIYFATWALQQQTSSLSLYNDSVAVFDPKANSVMSWILNYTATVYEAN